MTEPEIVTVCRDVDALLIPWGHDICIPSGSQVVITQKLGGTYTVNVNGNLARIAGKDADALGKEVIEYQKTKEISGDGSVDEERIWEQLKTCFDPEIPVNIVDLGLVYECIVVPMETGGSRVEVKMTLTAPGCGMGPVIAMDVEEKLLTIENIMEVKVELVFDPPWDTSVMSEEARLQLGML